MNKVRRSLIEKAQVKLQEVFDELEMLESEEQEAFDNSPEGIQLSERGEAMEAAVEALTEANASITEAIDQLNEAAQ